MLEYYKSLGVVEMSLTTLPGSQPNDPVLTNLFMYNPDHEDPVRQLWRNEHISVNDCFLKNIHKYKYIVNIDNDEIILPLKERNWHDMMTVVEQETGNKVFLLYSFLLKHMILDSWMLGFPEHIFHGRHDGPR